MRAVYVALTLMLVDFLDELGSGVTPLSAASVRAEFELGYESAALHLLVLPLLLASVVEAPLLLWSDAWARAWRRERIAALAMLVMALCIALAAQAPSAWAFSLSLAAWWAAAGVCCGVSQGALMTRFPEARERWMLRWTLMSSLGDALAPVLVLACTSLGASWRLALLAVAALHLIHALALGCLRLERGPSEPIDGDEELPSMWTALREGVGDARLMGWLFAAALCCLLDEIFVAFGALYLKEELELGPAMVAAGFGASSLAAALGSLACDRVLARADPLRTLIAASLSCALLYGAWLAAPGGPVSVALLAGVGLSCAPLYPICKARAYAQRPRQPGLVAALDPLFLVLPVLAPAGLGLVAARFGLRASLALLLLQPIGVACVALWVRARTR